MSGPTSKLFTPIKVGNIELKHRVVMAPMNRFRANSTHVQGDIAAEYYSQRASTPGSLIIAEASFISQAGSGYPNVPAIWNDEQVAGWKQVVDAVHGKGSFIFAQLAAAGRVADPQQLKREDPNLPFVGASDIGLKERPDQKPRALTIDEIKQYVRDWASAANNAIRAGFDGVEIHGANGNLVDQFLQDVSNNRTDAYGGSIENRARFALEVVDAVVQAVGAERVGIRLSPWGHYKEMGMIDPIPTFSYLVKRLKELYPDFAYVHVVDPRVEGYMTVGDQPGQSNDFIRDIWAPKPLINAGGFTPELAYKVAEETGDLIAFARWFISNPDLPVRILKNIPLAVADHAVFYAKEDPKGYIDFPFADTDGQH